MPDFTSNPASDLARRLEIRGGDSSTWFVILQPPAHSETALQLLVDELKAQFGDAVRAIEPSYGEIEQLRDVLHDPGEDIVILTGLDRWPDETWLAADINRSGLTRPGPLLFYVSAGALDRLGRHAPNLRSFIGGSIFQLSSEGGLMTPAERQRRLDEFGAHFHLTNAQVVSMAERKQLPHEPEFVEWLVLLERGDLV